MLLVGGRAQAVFGGGEILEPIEIYLAGRVTRAFGGATIPADEIAVEACRTWLASHLRGLDAARDVRIVPRLRPGSADLNALFARRDAAPLANDTACGVGFAPLTDLERTVLDVERALNAPGTKQRQPAIGEDIKVMGVRRGRRIDLTIGCAFVSRFVADLPGYLRAKADAVAIAEETARRSTGLEVHIAINAADDPAHGSVYLTVTGTSAEAGDDGEAGRGNRVSGLITPCRPMTIEAVAGKNPVTHVGKLYNLAAGRIADAAVRARLPIAHAECLLVSDIGSPIAEPRLVDIRLDTPDGATGPSITEPVAAIVRDELAHLPDLVEPLLQGRLTLY